MSFYQSFTSTRTAEPDWVSLNAQLRALDASAGVIMHALDRYTVKKATIWTAPQIAQAQNVIDTAPAASLQLSAQSKIDTMDIFDKAIVLTILDQFNFIRARLPTPLAAITVEQMIASIRTKAGTL